MKRLRKLLVATALAAVAIGVTAQPAFAAYGFYANSSYQPKGATVTSGLVSQINGGQAAVNIDNSSFYIQLRTFQDYPGYAVLASTSGTAPGYVYLNHALYTNKYSQCNWYISVAMPGTLPLSCAFKTP